jgi:hypothetical protein
MKQVASENIYKTKYYVTSKENRDGSSCMAQLLVSNKSGTTFWERNLFQMTEWWWVFLSRELLDHRLTEIKTSSSVRFEIDVKFRIKADDINILNMYCTSLAKETISHTVADGFTLYEFDTEKEAIEYLNIFKDNYQFNQGKPF